MATIQEIADTVARAVEALDGVEIHAAYGLGDAYPKAFTEQELRALRDADAGILTARVLLREVGRSLNESLAVSERVAESWDRR